MPGRVRAKIAAHRRRGRLVEEREPCVDLPGLDARAALPGEREHLHVPVADASAARRPRRRSSAARSRSPSANIAVRACDQEQPAVLGGLGQAREQALGVREPAARDGERASALVVPRERERHARRAELVARGRVRRVRTLAQRDRLVELAAPPGGLAVALEVRRRQLGVADTGVGAVRLAPGLARGSGAGLVERVDDLRHRPSLSLRAPARQCG